MKMVIKDKISWNEIGEAESLDVNVGNTLRYNGCFYEVMHVFWDLDLRVMTKYVHVKEIPRMP